MTHKWKHIGDTDCFTSLEVWWRRIPPNIEIEVELVNFYKSEPRPYKEGAYHDFAAVAIIDIPEMGVIKGEMFCITFPYVTFYRAIHPLPMSIKRDIRRDMNNDNIYIKFTKKNRENMTIHQMERLKEDPELTIKADELIYDKKENDLPDRRKKDDTKTTKTS